jgi:hypothetical protein
MMCPKKPLKGEAGYAQWDLLSIFASYPSMHKNSGKPVVKIKRQKAPTN